jgi:hypothetical protein
VLVETLHLSCLINEQKSKDAAEMDMTAFGLSWNVCTNCKHQYHNFLYLDLTSAFVSFAERVYGNGDSLWDKLRLMHSLLCKSASCLEPNQGWSRTEGKVITETLLSMIDNMKREYKMSRWLHKPKSSFDYKFYTKLSVDYEAKAYRNLGTMIYMDGIDREWTEVDASSMNCAVAHYKKALIIYKLLDQKRAEKDIEQQIAMLSQYDKTSFAGDRKKKVSSAQSKVNYERAIKTDGENKDTTISAGLFYLLNINVSNLNGYSQSCPLAAAVFLVLSTKPQ